MAVYRQIQITYWQDKFVLKLTPEEKFFYLYLLTNSKTKQCGIYELPIEIIQVETGYNRETVLKLIQRFIDHQKIKYDWENEEVFLLNWIKHNPIENNPKIKKCVEKELRSVHNPSMIPSNSPLIPLISPIQGVSQQEEKEEQGEKQEEQLTALFSSALYPPKLLEKEFISEIYSKFGYDKSKIIIRKFAGGNFRKVNTMREALNPDGTIKPKENEYKKEGKTVVYNPPK